MLSNSMQCIIIKQCILKAISLYIASNGQEVYNINYIYDIAADIHCYIIIHCAEWDSSVSKCIGVH